MRRGTRYTLVAMVLATMSRTPVHGDRRDRDDEDEEGPEAKKAAAFALDDMVEIAVQAAPDLWRAKAQRDAAKGAAGLARRSQQWEMTMNAQYQRDAIGQNVEVPLFTPVAQDSLQAAIAIGRMLPTGGRVQAELGISHVTTEQNFPAQLDAAVMMANAGQQLQEKYTVNQSTARLSVSQPLARGIGTDIALAEQQRADFQFSIATLEAQLAAEQMIRDVVVNYWELAYATYEIDTRHEGVMLAQQQEKVTREELRAGKSSQNAVNAVLYEISVRKERFLSSQIDAEKRSMELRRTAGLGLDRRDVMLRPTEKFDVGDEDWNIEKSLARSKKANRRLATTALQRKIADVDVKVAKNATLPQVDLKLSGALKGTADDAGGSFSAVSSGDGYEIMAGISVQLELSGAAKAGYDAALARRRTVEVEREALERQLDAEVVAAVKQVTFARERAALAEKAIFLAEDNAKAEKATFLIGRTTNYSVLQRQGELIEAKLRRGRAVADYHVAIATLQFLTGTILEQYRVNVRPKAER